MKAVVYDHHCTPVAELDGLPSKLKKAAEHFDAALQEAVLDGRGFDAVQGGRQLVPLPCELHRVVFNGKHALDVDHVEMLTRFSRAWLEHNGYLHEKEE